MCSIYSKCVLFYLCVLYCKCLCCNRLGFPFHGCMVTIYFRSNTLVIAFYFFCCVNVRPRLAEERLGPEETGLIVIVL